MQPLADAELARVVDGHLGPERPVELVVLLDAVVLVADVLRSMHSTSSTT
jgi:hypothetical protein